jgi:hypothetical protein
LDGDEKGGRVSEMRHPSRIENSVTLVETMVEHICSDHKAISLYGVKRIDTSYDVWVEYEGQVITVQSLTREIILHCTDPDEDTAMKFQSFIERGIRQGMKVLTPDVSCQ